MKKWLLLLLACLLPLTAAMAQEDPNWTVLIIHDEPVTIYGTEEVSRAEAMFGGLLLVNEWHSRPEDFDDSGMVKLYTLYSSARDAGIGSFWENSSCTLHPAAADALMELLTAAKAQGYSGLVVQANYAYRTYEAQNELFQKEVERYRQRYPDYSEDQLYARAKKNVNYPGTSEFNTGLAFCAYLYDGSDYYKVTPFFETDFGQWMLDNAWRYGFVFRYPTQTYPTADTIDKAYKTGVSSRLNCWRYVGKAHAAAMEHLGLCLEEYIEYLMDNPRIALYEDGMLKYEIVRQQNGEVEPIPVVHIVPQASFTVSLDNLGGTIIVYEY